MNALTLKLTTVLLALLALAVPCRAGSADLVDELFYKLYQTRKVLSSAEAELGRNEVTIKQVSYDVAELEAAFRAGKDAKTIQAGLDAASKALAAVTFKLDNVSKDIRESEQTLVILRREAARTGSRRLAGEIDRTFDMVARLADSTARCMNEVTAIMNSIERLQMLLDRA